MATSERGAVLVDWALSIVVLVGAAGGALGGTVLGAEAGAASRLAYGTLGAMFGSGLAIGVWGLLARLWTALHTGAHARHERDGAARTRPITPAPSAE
jgi:hypothetical protein